MNAGIWGTTGLEDVEAAEPVRAGAQQGALVGPVNWDLSPISLCHRSSQPSLLALLSLTQREE